MNEQQRITGPFHWEEGRPDIFKEWDGEYHIIGRVTDDLPWHENKSKASEEAGEHADIMADALNVHCQRGITASEAMRQRDALLAALEDARQWIEEAHEIYGRRCDNLDETDPHDERLARIKNVEAKAKSLKYV